MELGRTQTMNTIMEPARVLPVIDDCDVLVCGGGVAGIAAALPKGDAVQARDLRSWFRDQRVSVQHNAHH